MKRILLALFLLLSVRIASACSDVSAACTTDTDCCSLVCAQRGLGQFCQPVPSKNVFSGSLRFDLTNIVVLDKSDDPAGGNSGFTIKTSTKPVDLLLRLYSDDAIRYSFQGGISSSSSPNQGFRIYSGDSSYTGYTGLATGTNNTAVTYVFPQSVGSPNDILAITTGGAGSLTPLKWASLSSLPGGVTGTGTTDHLAKWATSSTLTDSVMFTDANFLYMSSLNLLLAANKYIRLDNTASNSRTVLKDTAGTGDANLIVDVKDDANPELALDSTGTLSLGNFTTTTALYCTSGVIDETCQPSGLWRPKLDVTYDLGVESGMRWRTLFAPKIDAGNDGLGTDTSLILQTDNAGGPINRLTIAGGASPAVTWNAIGSMSFANTSLSSINDLSATSVTTATFKSPSGAAGPAWTFNDAGQTTNDTATLWELKNNGTTREKILGDGTESVTVNVASTTGTNAADTITLNIPGGAISGGYTPLEYRVMPASANTGTGSIYGTLPQLNDLNGTYSTVIVGRDEAQFTKNMTVSDLKGTHAVMILGSFSGAGSFYTRVAGSEATFGDVTAAAPSATTDLYGFVMTNDGFQQNWGATTVTNLYGFYMNDFTDTTSTNIHGFAVAHDSNLLRDKRLFWSSALSSNVTARDGSVDWDSTDNRLELEAGTTTVLAVAANTIDYPLMRRTGFMQPVDVQATTVTLTGVGISNPTATSAAAPTRLNIVGTRLYIQWNSGATNGNAAGIEGPYNTTRPLFRPKLTSRIRTEVPITTRRIWVGLAASTLKAVAVNGATAIEYVAVGYEAGVNSGKWMCCSGNGTSSCTDMGVTVAAGTEYAITADYSVSGTLTCRVDSTVKTKTTNLPSTAADWGIHNALTTLDNTDRDHQVATIWLEQN